MLGKAAALTALLGLALGASLSNPDETLSTPESEPTSPPEPTPPPPPMRLICGDIFTVSETSPRGYLHSPDFPLAYPANATCRWEIRGPFGFRVLLDLRSVDTELDYDFLSLHAGEAAENSRVFSLSGRDAGRSVLFGSNVATVTFSSDAYVSGGGFIATFRLLRPGSDGSLVGPSGVVLSPNYPATFTPAAPLQEQQPSLAMTLGDAYVPQFRILNPNASHLDVHTYLFNVSRGNGMNIHFPDVLLPEGASIELLDVAEGCDLDSPRSLDVTQAQSSQTFYSECSSVRVSILAPPMLASRYRVEYAEVCQHLHCYPNYYLGHWAALSFNLLFFATLLGFLGACCCCCSQACKAPRRRSPPPPRPAPGAAFPNPNFRRSAASLAEQAGPLPEKTLPKA